MGKYKGIVTLLLSLVFIFFMLYFTFRNEEVFWYLYAFTIMVGMAISILHEKPNDELATWKYLTFGIGYGTIAYSIVKVGYWVISKINQDWLRLIDKFLTTYSPLNIWHLILLVLIISVGEELFWRGYIQQQLKAYVTPFVAVVLAALLFSMSIYLSGFLLGAIASFIVGVIFGLLYEWRKSMPLIIVAHVVFVLLIFLILPLK